LNIKYAGIFKQMLSIYMIWICLPHYRRWYVTCRKL